MTRFGLLIALLACLVTLCQGAALPCDSASEECTWSHSVVPDSSGRWSDEKWSYMNAYNCTDCGLPMITEFGRLSLCQAYLLPSWLLAVAVGVIGGIKIHRLGANFVGSRSYAVTFFTYAVMMSSGFVVHCVYLQECGVPLSHDQLRGYNVFAIIDASLTSFIAMTFFFNGLVDLRVLREDRKWLWCFQVITLGLIVTGYLKGLPWELMYVGTVAFGCGMFLLMQLYKIARTKKATGFGWLLFAGVVGGLCFSVIYNVKSYCTLCKTFGVWIFETVWYYGADVAMALMAVFVIRSRANGARKGDYEPAQLSAEQPSIAYTLMDYTDE